jgi:O-antigen/teichoic acid export membrane protein
MISVFTFPVLAALALLSKEFIMVFLTSKWLPMQFPLLVLTPMAMLKSIGMIRASVLMARGRPEILVIWNAAYFLPLVGVVYWGTQYGLAGVSLAFTILYVLTFPIIQYLTDRQAGVSTKEFLLSIASTFTATCFMMTTGYVFKFIMGQVFHLNDLVVLLAGSIFCLCVYAAWLWIFDRGILLELYELSFRPKNRLGKNIPKISDIELEL